MLFFFFFNDTATTEIYTLSLHDALPICFTFSFSGSTIENILSNNPFCSSVIGRSLSTISQEAGISSKQAIKVRSEEHTSELRHANISYAVFCLKKKNTTNLIDQHHSVTV